MKVMLIMKQTIMLKVINVHKMKYLKYSQLLICLLIFLGCKSYKTNIKSNDLTSIINSHFQNSKQAKIKIYYKTLTSKNVKWKENLKYDKLNYNFSPSGRMIDFTDILTRKDIEYLKHQTSNLRQEKINNLDSPAELVKNKNQANIWYFSQPIFTLNHNYAFIYEQKGESGESIAVCQRKNEKWEFMCEVPISIV